MLQSVYKMERHVSTDTGRNTKRIASETNFLAFVKHLHEFRSERMGNLIPVDWNAAFQSVMITFLFPLESCVSHCLHIKTNFQLS